MIVTIIGYIVGALGLVGIGFAVFFALKLREWERLLQGARVAIAYNNRPKMQPTLMELLQWAIIVERDKHATGKAFYKMNKTTVAILQPRDKSHGKTVTTEVKRAA